MLAFQGCRVLFFRSVVDQDDLQAADGYREAGQRLSGEGVLNLEDEVETGEDASSEHQFAKGGCSHTGMAIDASIQGQANFFTDVHVFGFSVRLNF